MKIDLQNKLEELIDWWRVIKAWAFKTQFAMPIISVTTLILICLFFISIFNGCNNHSYARIFVADKIEYRQDTMIFKGDYDKSVYLFCNEELDTLKKIFQKAEQMAKYCNRHRIDADYQKTLAVLKGIEITFMYDGSIWDNSSIIISKSNDWSYNHVYLRRKSDFMDYFGKYKRICKRLEDRRKANIGKLNKYANELNNL